MLKESSLMTQHIMLQNTMSTVSCCIQPGFVLSRSTVCPTSSTPAQAFQGCSGSSCSVTGRPQQFFRQNILVACGRPYEVCKDYVWNLAIGSNMDEATMRRRTAQGRRKIVPLSPPIPATADNWALAMDLLFIPPTEPAFAGAVPRDGEKLHGTLYKLSKYDYETLSMTEGINVKDSLYKEQVVDAVPYPNVQSDQGPAGVVRSVVFALRHPPRTPLDQRRLYPSPRYKKMMVDGAEAAQLDPNFVGKLRDMPTAPPVRARMIGYTRFCSLGMFAFIRSAFERWFARKYYRPAIAWAYSNREKAVAEGQKLRQVAFSALMLLIMFPLVCVGFVVALAKRKNVLQIARGQLPAFTTGN